jgi:hypothetical protein
MPPLNDDIVILSSVGSLGARPQQPQQAQTLTIIYHHWHEVVEFALCRGLSCSILTPTPTGLTCPHVIIKGSQPKHRNEISKTHMNIQCQQYLV